jgi:pyrimidine operon attenuation protein / uracil phosphoribosyltransferase
MKEILDARGMDRALTRIAHEVLERYRGASELYLIGVRTRGVALAHRLAGLIQRIEGAEVSVGELDARGHRDDLDRRGLPSADETVLPIPVTDKRVVLVDDVIYTGRTVRAALDAIMRHGRPASIALAVFVDRGHRELPISPDFVGRNIPTSRDEKVRVHLEELDGEDCVAVGQPEDDQ